MAGKAENPLVTGAPKPGPAWPVRLAGLSIVVFVALAVAFGTVGGGRARESPLLLTLLNTLFGAAISLLIAHIAGRSYLRTGARSHLYLCAGSWTFAITYLLVGPLLAHGLGRAVALHNAGVLLAAAWFVMSARRAMLEHPGADSAGSAWYLLALALAMPVAVLALVLWSAGAQVIPSFFEPGGEPTPLRQAVLGLAAAGYLVASLWFGILHRRAPSPFLVWYALGLALIGLGLVAVLPGPPGTSLGWVGRTGQYLGSFYLLVAALSLERGAGSWRIPLERALRDREEELSSVFDLFAVGMAFGDPLTQRLTRVNDRLCDITGYGRDELLGLTWSELTVPEDREQYAAAIARALRRETAGWNTVMRYRRKDGAAAWVQVTGTVRFDADGRPWQTATIIEDINEHVEADAERERLLAEVQRSAAELDAVFRTLPFLVAVIGPDGSYVRVNPTLVELFGFDPTATPREEAARRLDARLPDGTPLTPENMPSSRALRGEQVEEVEYQITDARGERRTLLLNALPLRDDGRIYGALLAQRDITAERRAAERIAHLATFPELTPSAVLEFDLTGAVTFLNPAAREALRTLGLEDDAGVLLPEDCRCLFQAARGGEGERHLAREVEVKGRIFGERLQALPELGVVRVYARDLTELKAAEREHARLFAQLEQAHAELQRSNRDLALFASAVSHDLKEPLRAVSGYAALLQGKYGDRLDERAGGYLAGVRDGAERMQRLIDDLLAYSRIGSRGGELRRTNAEAALAAAVANLRLAIEETGAALTHDPLPIVRSDTTQLVELFQNLIANALKFRGAERPRVHVGATRDTDRWCFFVRDNGIGIEPRFHERIFEIFQRLHPRSRCPGTGIGLAICKRIVERHAGRIWVESAPGQGATFFFTLPEANDRSR